MKHALPPLDSLKVFECAARHLSFSRAAEELCLSKGAVSYQIGKLEDRLGKILFKRTVRQVLLTDSGQLLFQTTQKLFEELGETLRRIGHEGERHVSIAATTYVAARWLSPRIAGFTARFPDVSIVLHHAVNGPDFSIDTADITIRWDCCKGSKDPACLCEMPMPLYPVGSPDLLRRIESPPTATGMAAIPLLCEERSLDLWREWDAGRGLLAECPRRIIVDANVRVQAAIDGQGLVLADELMRAELDNGILVSALEGRLEGYGYRIMSSPSRFKSTDTIMLTEWLVDSCDPS